jgi:hypothetical protein
MVSSPRVGRIDATAASPPSSATSPTALVNSPKDIRSTGAVADLAAAHTRRSALLGTPLVRSASCTFLALSCPWLDGPAAAQISQTTARETALLLVLVLHLVPSRLVLLVQLTVLVLLALVSVLVFVLVLVLVVGAVALVLGVSAAPATL